MQSVPLKLPFIASIDSIPLFLVILLNVIIGIIIGGFLAAISNVQKIIKNHPNKKAYKSMQKKLEEIEG